MPGDRCAAVRAGTPWRRRPLDGSAQAAHHDGKHEQDEHDRHDPAPRPRIHVRRLALGLKLGAVVVGAAAAMAGCAAGRGAALPAPSPVGVPATAGPRADTSPLPGTSTTASPASPCVGAPAPARYDHVLWIVMENKPTGRAVGSPESPELTSVARACAVATDYRAVSHPSLPNYLALTSGSTHGVTDDHGPDAHPLPGASIFSEVTDAGGSWKTYAESMARPCRRTPAGRYATKHNPALYYTALTASCHADDVPLGTTTSGPLASALRDATLPSYALLVPDLCADTHDCPVSDGDRWLGRWLAAITSSSTYADGRTAVFVTWDEDDRSAGNAVDLVAIAPSIRPGTRAAGSFTHLSLLRTTEDLLGLGTTLVPTAASMRDPLGL